jgi:hypothetical protein
MVLPAFFVALQQQIHRPEKQRASRSSKCNTKEVSVSFGYLTTAIFRNRTTISPHRRTCSFVHQFAPCRRIQHRASVCFKIIVLAQDGDEALGNTISAAN